MNAARTIPTRGRFAATQPRTSARPARIARPLAEPRRAAFTTAPLDPLDDPRTWGADTQIEGKSARLGGTRLSPSDAALPLADMVDRASAQLVILRRTLDEASSVNRQTRQGAGELDARLEETRAACDLIDERLSAAEAASGVLEKAANTLRGLEHLVGQIRNATGALEERVLARLAEQERGYEQRLKELERRFEQRIAQVEAESERAGEETDRRLRRDTDRVSAEIDRRTAQVQARVSLVLDSASDRVQTLEHQAEHIGGVITDRVENLCRGAAWVLGHDPRTGGAREPAAGSLAERVTALRALVRDAEDASIRLAALVGEAEARGGTLGNPHPPHPA